MQDANEAFFFYAARTTMFAFSGGAPFNARSWFDAVITWLVIAVPRGCCAFALEFEGRDMWLWKFDNFVN